MSFKITRIAPPSAAANTAPRPSGTPLATALAGGNVLRGVITGTTASGHPVVQTPSGVFSLNAQSTAPRGSTLTLQVIEPPKFSRPVAATSIHPGQESASIFADRRWPPLQQAIQVLHDVNPAASRHFIAATLPRPDGQLTSGLIFFLTALRGGDLRSWFGDANLAVLQKSRPALANRLANDFSTLARVAEEPVGADWRVAMIPINTGSQIEQIRMLFRRHDNDEDENADGDMGTRFILDVNLTRLGRLQLDGLVRNQGKKLDLILRSDDVLDDQNRNDIRRVFSQAAELTGLQGSVSFQASPPDFIDIPDPLADHNVGLIV
ncbi:MAG TPA: hypothetical protein ENI69_03635 [Rhodospirillales bacterium]|nr:hypothetical protein [Rhodospirillales bacterium]